MPGDPAEILQKVLQRYGTIHNFQAESGLDITGFMRDEDLRTAELVLAGAPAVPLESRAHEVYGRVPFRDLGNGRVRVNEDWATRHIVRTVLPGGLAIYLHDSIADTFGPVFTRACAVSGYTPRVVQSWIPQRQQKDPSRPLSMHAYGAAINVDPARNGKEGKDPLTGGRSLLREHLEFVEVLEQAGWSWGGYSRGRADCHFQRAWY